MENRERIQSRFLEHAWAMIGYWRDQPLGEAEKMEGVVFSLLTALDGGAAVQPFAVIPVDDEGRINAELDIGGDLHENFHRIGEALRKGK